MIQVKCNLSDQDGQNLEWVQPGNRLVTQTTLDYEHCTSRWVQMQITLVPPVRPNKQWTVWECYTSRYTCVLNDYHNIPNQQWELA